MKDENDSNGSESNIGKPEIVLRFQISPEMIESALRLRRDFEQLKINATLTDLAKRSYRVNYEMLESYKRLEILPIAEIIKTQERFSAIAKSLSESPRLNPDFVNPSWVRDLHTIAQEMERIKKDLGDSILAMANNTLISERFLQGIDLTNFIERSKLSQNIALQFSNSINAYAKHYLIFFDSFQNHESLLRIPKPILENTSSELIETSFAVNVVTNEIDIPEEQFPYFLDNFDEERQRFTPLLEGIHPDLVIPLTGAYDALHSTSLDRARHCTVSLRQLIGDVVHQLSPDEQVWNWLPENPPDDLVHDGKITIQARFKYLTRRIESEKFDKLVILDAQCCRELLGLTNDLHETKPEFSDFELKLLVHRAVTLVYYLISIAKSDY